MDKLGDRQVPKGIYHRTEEHRKLLHLNYLKKGFKLSLETRKCRCGCNQTLECSPRSDQTYIKWHYHKKRKKDAEFTEETRICACGCGESFKLTKRYQILRNIKYIVGHNQRGYIPTKETILKIVSKTRGQKRTAEQLETFKRAHLNRIYTKEHPYHNTTSEILMKSILIALGFKYLTQYPIKDIEHSYKVDFYLPSLNLVIEVDGLYWHATPKKYKENDLIKFPNNKFIKASEIWGRDRIRTTEMKLAGYKVLRFWENEFNQETVREAIDQHCWEPVLFN